MQMSEKEIVRSYTNAKDKRSQVGVLAELNACPNDTIREILERNGISAPKPGRKSQKKEEPKKPKAQLTEKAKRLLKTEEPDDQGKKAERLIKTDETKKVGTKSENRQLKIEHSDQEGDLNLNFDACAWAYSMDDYDSDTLIFASEEMNKAKEQIAAMEQDIRRKKLEISTLKCKVKYLNLWLMHRGWREEKEENKT